MSEDRTASDRGRHPLQNMAQVIEKWIKEIDVAKERRPEAAEGLEGLKQDLAAVLQRLHTMRKG